MTSRRSAHTVLARKCMVATTQLVFLNQMKLMLTVTYMRCCVMLRHLSKFIKLKATGIGLHIL